MLDNKFQEMKTHGVVDADGAVVGVFLPTTYWNYLAWLKTQGFNFDAFTKECDARRHTIEHGKKVILSDFLIFATDRLGQLHHFPLEDRTNVRQPVFPHHIEQAIDKTESYFRNSGKKPGRFNGWHP